MPGFGDLSVLKQIWRFINTAILHFFFQKVLWGEGARVRGWPRIYVHSDGQIRIGPNVLLNSSPRGYHTGMPFPVTLIADRPKAHIEIGKDSRLHGCCLHAWSMITVGERCLFAAGSQVLDAHGHESRLECPSQRQNTPDQPASVKIGDDCWIGLNAIVLKGVNLGNGSIVAAGSVVLPGTYPPSSLLAGNPAKIVKTI